MVQEGGGIREKVLVIIDGRKQTADCAFVLLPGLRQLSIEPVVDLRKPSATCIKSKKPL